jgi:hypothetical protein
MRFIGQGVEADVTPTRAANLDNLAVAPNTVTPDNAGIAAIKARTDLLPASPAAAGDAAAALLAYDAVTQSDLNTAQTNIISGVGALVSDDPDQTVVDQINYTIVNNAAPTAVQVREEIDANSTRLATLTNRLGAFTGTGVNTVLGLFKALARKDATLPTDIGGTFAVATDSLEAQAETVAAIKAQTDRITGATIYANNPVSADGGTLTLVTDNDYTAAHARPASWTDTNTALTGAVVSLKLPKADGTFTSITGTATAITGGFTLSFDVTRAQVTTTVSGYGYILATWAADSQQATPIRHIVVDRQAVA